MRRLLDAISDYHDSHTPFARSRLGKLVCRWAATKKRHLAHLGAVPVLDSTFLSAFLVAKGGKAILNVYVGRSWMVRGRSVGKTLHRSARFRLFDFSADLYARYGA